MENIFILYLLRNRTYVLLYPIIGLMSHQQLRCTLVNIGGITAKTK